ncbi:MAG: methyltransferase domain-containing protein [Verrucomicrobiota bacterium]|jgi:predicted SAM-dependent methyltransferase
MSLYEKIAHKAEHNEILFHTGKAMQLLLLRLKGMISFGRSRVIANYLKSHPVSKLQLGSGLKLLDGWLNTDCSLFFRAECFLDVTRPFPFEDKVFNYVFTEHLIEHLTYPEGVAMLQECHRVLKPGGSIRVTCPDLRILVGLYATEKTGAQKQFIKTMVDNSLPHIRIYKESFVINNSIRNWGHKFIYDQETLTAAMESVGFTEVTRFNLCESNDLNLQGLESHGPGDEAKCFETMVLQAKRPG